eukprot:TRINITY_DN15672_c0_g1_i1.p1 TRINITY_DN15672_c0_g1~~TRINITY_DN15672_c0_g1_i1.p1  ORF type:complete len:276 (-),score=48.57 TRINITY_DN15672_c0_g1_i1:79-798(-)
MAVGYEPLPHSRMNLSIDEMAQQLHLPLPQAAKELGMSPALLKRFCRHYGLKRWPYRKAQSVSRQLLQLQSIPKAVASPKLQEGIDWLKKLRYSVFQHITETTLDNLILKLIPLALEGQRKKKRAKRVVSDDDEPYKITSHRLRHHQRVSSSHSDDDYEEDEDAPYSPPDSVSVSDEHFASEHEEEPHQVPSVPDTGDNMTFQYNTLDEDLLNNVLFNYSAPDLDLSLDEVPILESFAV